MFYGFFKKVYYKIRDQINHDNLARLNNTKPLEGVEVKSYNYTNELGFNIYMPQDKETKAFIIDIHGGGWISGDKDTNRNFCSYLAKEGFVVSSLDYRLIDVSTHKDQVIDVLNYVNYLVSHKEELNINLDKVVLTGDSAGAEFALLLYAIMKDEALAKLFDTTISSLNVLGLILNHSVTFLDQAGSLDGHKYLSKFVAIPGMLRILFADKKYETNPLYQKIKNPRAYLKHIPLVPIMLVTSLGDNNYYYQTILLDKYLTEINAKHTLYVEEDLKASHVFNITDPTSFLGVKCNKEIINFISKLI